MITGFFAMISARNATEMRIIKIAISPEMDESVGFKLCRSSLVRILRNIVFNNPPRANGIKNKKKRFFNSIKREK
jgi:hypothetical protein